MADRAILYKVVAGLQGGRVANADEIEVDATGFDGTGNLSSTDNTIQLVAQKLNDYAGASESELQAAIQALPSANPNFYYERLGPTSGFDVPADTLSVPIDGDGATLVIVDERTSVGGIRPGIPFETLWQGQIEIGSASSGTIEFEATFQHFYNTPNQFDITRRIRVDIAANQPVTQNLNAFSSEAVVSLGSYPLPGGGTLEFTDELLAAPFQYRYILNVKAFELGTETRAAKTLSTFDFLSPTIIFKQANRIVGPQGERGDPGTTTAFAATAQYSTLFDGVTDNAVDTAQTVTLTFPDGITDINEFGLLEIGTSRTSTGNISKNVISAQSVSTATSANPYHYFPADATGTAQLGSSYSIYPSTKNTLVYDGGSNRGFLRSVIGITFGIAANPAGWDIQDTLITPDSTATPVATLPTGEDVLENFAYRIDGDGFLRGTEVTDGDWLLALQDNPSSTNLSNWDIISGNRFPVSSTLFHFDDQISEVNIRKTTGLATALGATNALAWLSPATLATAPFLIPGDDPDNPRTGQTVAYVGGRTDRNTDLQFTFASDRIQNYLYIGITPAFITSNTEANIDVVVLDGDREVARYNLADNFRFLDDDSFTNTTARHYVYDGDGTNQQEPINYTGGNVIQIVVAETGRGFTIDSDNVNLTNNIKDLQEDQLSQDVQTKLNTVLSDYPWASVAEVLFSGATVREDSENDRIQYADRYSKGIDWRDMAESITINEDRYIDDSLTIVASNISFEISGFGNNLRKLIGIQLQRNDASSFDGALIEIASDIGFLRINTSNHIEINITPGSSADWQPLTDQFGAVTISAGSDNFLLFEIIPHPFTSGVYRVVAELYNGTTYNELNDLDFTPTSAIAGDHLGISRSTDQRGQIIRFSAIISPGYLSHNQLDSILRNHQDDKWNFGYARLIEGSTSREVVFQTNIDANNDLKRGGNQVPNILTGTAPPTITPEFIGQEFIDTDAKIVYKATDTTGSTDWVALNS